MQLSKAIVTALGITTTLLIPNISNAAQDKPNFPRHSGTYVFNLNEKVHIALVNTGGGDIAECKVLGKGRLPEGLEIQANNRKTTCVIKGTTTSPVGKNLIKIRGKNSSGRLDITTLEYTVKGAKLSFARPKQFVFKWSPLGGAHHYSIKENANGNQAFVEVGTTSGTSFTIKDVPLHKRINAQYQIDSCNKNNVCKEYAQLSVSGNLEDAIGLLKAPRVLTKPFAGFGSAVALSADGNTLAVGAETETWYSTRPRSGAVHIFVKDSNYAWKHEKTVYASNLATNDKFGSAIALSKDGKTLAVGAWSEGNPVSGIHYTPDLLDVGVNGNHGAVYLFTKESSWKQQAYIKPADLPNARKNFGYNLALDADGNTLAVYARESSALLGGGSVYLFDLTVTYVRPEGGGRHRVKQSIWSQNTRLQSPVGVSDDFGYGIALDDSGGALIVGAPHTDSGKGAAYVYRKVYNKGWTLVETLEPKTSTTLFGRSVATNNNTDTIAVGGKHPSGFGAVFIFNKKRGWKWLHSTTLNPSSPMYDSPYGGDYAGFRSIALNSDGRTLIVGSGSNSGNSVGLNGSRFTSDHNTRYSGAAHMFVKEGKSWGQAEKVFIKPMNPYHLSDFGNKAVAISSDSNTLVIGSQFERSLSQEDLAYPNLSGYVPFGGVYLY